MNFEIQMHSGANSINLTIYYITSSDGIHLYFVGRITDSNMNYRITLTSESNLERGSVFFPKIKLLVSHEDFSKTYNTFVSYFFVNIVGVRL